MPRNAPTAQDPFGFGGLVLPVVNFGGTSVTAWPGANRGLFTRVLNGGSISKVRMEVGTASGNISVAAYASNGTGADALPSGAPLASSGAVACPASGRADVALGSTVSLAPGDWLFLSCDNTTATFRALGLTTAVLWPGIVSRQDSAHPAPTVGAQAVTSYCPVLIGVA